jgi:hypothetical protein
MKFKVGDRIRRTSDVFLSQLKQVYDINGFVTVRRVVESRNRYCFVGDEDVLITMKSDGWELIEDSWEKIQWKPNKPKKFKI